LLTWSFLGKDLVTNIILLDLPLLEVLCLICKVSKVKLSVCIAAWNRIHWVFSQGVALFNAAWAKLGRGSEGLMLGPALILNGSGRQLQALSCDIHPGTWFPPFTMTSFLSMTSAL
jgi:hypothetical protein